MRVSEIYSGQYLKAIDLGGRAVQVQISDVTVETFDEGQKLMLHFAGKDKSLVCNKTNSSIIAAGLGDETDAWKGQIIELYPDKVNFQGKLVDALRVRIPVPPAEPAAVPVVQPAPAVAASTPTASSDDGIVW